MAKLYSIIENVNGIITTTSGGWNYLDLAIKGCEERIHETFGGEVYVVDADVAQKLEGAEMAQESFPYYGVDGKIRQQATSGGFKECMNCHRYFSELSAQGICVECN